MIIVNITTTKHLHKVCTVTQAWTYISMTKGYVVFSTGNSNRRWFVEQSIWNLSASKVLAIHPQRMALNMESLGKHSS